MIFDFWNSAFSPKKSLCELFLIFFWISDHGHKKFGRLWEQIIFPYDRLKSSYSCWHITPIQIVAELRDPKKLKKPKRPDLIQAQATLPLPYPIHQNPGKSLCEFFSGSYFLTLSNFSQNLNKSSKIRTVRKKRR